MGPMHSAATDRFAHAIRDYFSIPGRALQPDIRLEAAGTDAEGAVVILYRDRRNGTLFGRRYRVDELSLLFSPKTSPEDLATTVIVDDILEPSGPGRPLAVAWADGLVENPAEVRWLGA